MPTIKELEAERAKILEEIQSKAQTGANGPSSLQEFLSAAEEIVPDSLMDDRTAQTPYAQDPAYEPPAAKIPEQNLSAANEAINFTVSDVDEVDDDFVEFTQTARSEPQRAQANTNINQPTNTVNSQATSEFQQTLNDSRPQPDLRSDSRPMNNSANTNPPTKDNRMTFVGVLVMLLMFITTLIIVFFSYNDLDQKLQEAVQMRNDTQEQVFALQEYILKLKDAAAIGENANNKFSAVDQQLQQLNTMMLALQKRLNEAPANGSGVMLQGEETIAAIDSMLEDKLTVFSERLTSQIEQKIDLKLAAIIQRIEKAEANNKITGESVKPKPIKTPVSINTQLDEEQMIAEPMAPMEPMIAKVTPKKAEITPEIVPKQIEKPIFSLKAESEKPKIVTTPNVDENTPQDIKWLLGEPSMHYTLQLASMPNKEALEKMKENMRLVEARIIPQTYKGKTNYILVTDSYTSRTQANQKSQAIKEQTGIAPWVRKISSIVQKLD